MEENQQQTPQPTARSGSAEKVIQPTDPNLTASARPMPLAPVAPASSYDPTSPSPSAGSVPILDLRKTMEDHSDKHLSIQHKTLMILAIIGLLKAAYAVLFNHDIQQALFNGNAAGVSQTGLYILYVIIGTSLFINIYFLLAKNRHTVTTVLKILLVLQVIAVFGVFWGAAPNKGVNLLVDAAYLLYTYIVFNIVRTEPAL